LEQSGRPPVRLSVPARTESVRLVRLVAAGVGADAGLDVDAIEDLRLGVAELFALLVGDEDDPASVIEVSYRAHDGAVAVEGMREGWGAEAPEPDELARDLLAVVVDEHELVAEGERYAFRLLKRVTPAG
jgi:anti-sigma regulatory factor (Ser/Thr protein kinase)